MDVSDDLGFFLFHFLRVQVQAYLHIIVLDNSDELLAEFVALPDAELLDRGVVHQLHVDGLLGSESELDFCWIFTIEDYLAKGPHFCPEDQRTRSHGILMGNS